jgi:peptidyl-prolyl cis-trans isomerase D
MIQWMHTFSKHWIVTVMMGALTLSFVLWGIGLEQFGIGTPTQVAKIGSAEIGSLEFQRTYRNFLRNQSERMGQEITPEMAEKMGLGQVALQQMIARTAVQNEAAKLGLITSDGAVVQNVRGMAPFRGTLGSFDRPTFLQAIARAEYTEAQFLTEIRQEMTVEQLTQAVSDNFMLPISYAQAIAQFIGERRAADYVVLTPAMAGEIAAPDEAALTAYVKANAARYSTPEYREAEYAAIAPSDVIASITVTDAQIQQQYDANKSTYVVPEKRDVQQIDFKTLAEAQAGRAKIASGTSFDALAAERGLKPEQISLGTLAQDELPDAERAKAIFALPLNDVSQPVKTGFGGFVLAKVTKIAPGSTKTLAEVKEDIRKALTSQIADNKMVDVINAYTDARSNGDDFAEAAKKSGMKLARISAVDTSGLKPDGAAADVPADPEFLPAVFKAEVGDDVDPFATKLGAYYTIHVIGVTPPKLKPLELVRAQAQNDYINDQRGKQLATKGAESGGAGPQGQVAGGRRQAVERARPAQPRFDPRYQRPHLLRPDGGPPVYGAAGRRGCRTARRKRQLHDRAGFRHQPSGAEPPGSRLPGRRDALFPNGGAGLCHRPSDRRARPPGREGQPEAGQLPHRLRPVMT